MSKQKIKITYNYKVAFNNIKQRAVFWSGFENELKEIPNFFVRDLAKQVLKTGKTIKKGIWKIELLKPKSI